MIYIVNNLVKELTTVKQISNMMMCSRPPNIPNHSPSSFLYNNFTVKEEDEEDCDDDETDDDDDDESDDSDETDDEEEVKILILDDEIVNHSIYVHPSSGVVEELNSLHIPLPDESKEKLLVDTVSPCSISDNSSVPELSWNDLSLGESQLEQLVPITTEGEISSHWGEIDESYKKMSIPELRSIVVSKGLTQDASKMKKTELFKLLQV
jgi:hypothetical protein